MTDIPGIESEEIKTAEKSIDPRLNDYTNEFQKSLLKEFPEFTPEQIAKAMSVSQEFALQRIKIEDSADSDQLTDLLTRKGLYKTIDQKLQQYQRELQTGKPISEINAAFLYIDLDGFKRVNDTSGHRTGDLVLSATGQFLGTAFRPTDIVGRHGGDEFIVFLDGADLNNAVIVAERIRTEFTGVASDLFPQLQWLKTISIGVCRLSDLSPEKLASEESRMELIEHFIKEADNAHYKGAKHVGKNRIGVMLDNGEIRTAIITSSEGQPTTISYTKP